MRKLIKLFTGLILIGCFSANLMAGEIHDAAKAGDIEKIKTILEADQTRLLSQDKIGYTALHWAALRGKSETIRYLITAGAKVNAFGVDGNSPLHSAANFGNVAMIGLMIKKGSIVDNKNNSGMTPLHMTSQAGNNKAATILIFQGADVNALSNEGWTPLYLAQLSGQTELAGLLKRSGASLEFLDSDGKNADEIRTVRPRKKDADLSKLEEYVGRYSLDDNFISKVWVEDGRLWVEDYALHPTYPIGVDSFYCEKQPWTISFARNDNNEVDSIYFGLLRRTVGGLKVDDDFKLTSADTKLGLTARSATRFEFTYSTLKSIFRLEGPSDTIAASVTFVMEGSPADRAGFLQRDVILTFNNNMVMNAEELYQLIKEVEPGTIAPAEILRRGAIESLIIKFD